jgi:hypothetical protein
MKRTESKADHETLSQRTCKGCVHSDGRGLSVVQELSERSVKMWLPLVRSGANSFSGRHTTPHAGSAGTGRRRECHPCLDTPAGFPRVQYTRGLRLSSSPHPPTPAFALPMPLSRRLLITLTLFTTVSFFSWPSTTAQEVPTPLVVCVCVCVCVQRAQACPPYVLTASFSVVCECASVHVPPASSHATRGGGGVLTQRGRGRSATTVLRSRTHFEGGCVGWGRADMA